MHNPVKTISTLALFLLVFLSSFFYLHWSNTITKAQAVACQTGFDRPLLFGIIPAYVGTAIEEMDELNASTTTLSFDWPNFEPTEGNLQADFMDLGVDKSTAAGIEVIGWINGTPDWAKENPNLPAHKSLPDKSKQAQYENFVRTIVTRHKGKIKIWKYWNEPNGCGSSRADCGASSEDIDRYVYWLNVTYDVIKSVDPTIQVVGGNLDFSTTDTGYIRNMEERGAKFDILGIHPYTKDTAVPLDFGKIEAAYNQQKTKRPIILGEWGWDLNWPGMNTQIAGEFVNDALVKLMDAKYSYVIGAYYHALRDVGGAYGLRTADDIRFHGSAFQNVSAVGCSPIDQSVPTPTPVITPTPPASSPQLKCTGFEIQDSQGKKISELTTHGFPYLATPVNQAFSLVGSATDSQLLAGTSQDICWSLAGQSNAFYARGGDVWVCENFSANSNSNGINPNVAGVKSVNRTFEQYKSILISRAAPDVKTLIEEKVDTVGLAFAYNFTSKATPGLMCSSNFGINSGYGVYYLNGQKQEENNCATTPENYRCIAYVEPTGNSCPLQADTDDDCDVDIYDFNAIVTAFGTRTGNQHFNPKADFNQNGEIDVFDYNLVIQEFGKDEANGMN